MRKRWIPARAQRLRRGTYVPDYLGGTRKGGRKGGREGWRKVPPLSFWSLKQSHHVNVSVNAHIEGFKRNSSRIMVEGGKKGGKGGAGVHYSRLPVAGRAGGGGACGRGGGIKERGGKRDDGHRGVSVW